MVCAFCLWLMAHPNGTLLETPDPAVTAVQGTALCETHAVEKMEKLGVLQGMGVR